MRGRCDAGRADVYNLTVAGTPEYFANGILVHNCADALRYLLMALGGRPVFHVIADETYNEIMNPGPVAGKQIGSGFYLPENYESPFSEGEE